jgi:HlyD family secretion protein
MKRSTYIWIGTAIVVLIIIGAIVHAKKSKPKNTVAYTVATQDVKQTVIATGTVTSQADLNLGFKGTGTIAVVNVAVGDKVHQGQVLMQLDESSASTSIQQARAGVVTAQANYDKVVDGSSSDQIAVQQAAVAAAQVAVQNAQTAYKNTVSQQNTAVQNAQTAEYNAGLAAVPAASNSSTSTVAVSGTYTGTQTGSYNVTIVATGSGNTYSYNGIETGNGNVQTGIPLPLGKLGLFITFSSTGTVHAGDMWTIQVPNMQSSAYLTASNNYQAALQTQQQEVSNAQSEINSAQAALQQAQAQLTLNQSAALPADVEAAQGQLQTAQAALAAAQNQYNNNIITAPIDGTISQVNGTVGAAPGINPIVLIDQNSLHVESEISESSIALVQPGQSIDMTFDAFGPDQHFTGTVLSIDPASTVISGVTDFRVVSSLPTPVNPTIKTGLSVNLSILTNEKQNVIAIPNRLLQTDANGKQFVTIVEDGGKSTKNVDITTGLSGDTYTEVTSGLSGGEQLAAPTNS